MSTTKPSRDGVASNLRTIRARLSDLGPGPGTSPRSVAAFDLLTELAGARAYPRGGSGGGRAGGHSDPTAQTAEDEQRNNEAKRLLADRDLIFRKLETAADAMDEAHAVIDLLFNPRTPIKHEPGCENCNGVKGNDGRAHELSWQKVKARGLCGFCYRFQYGDGPKSPGYGVPPVLDLLRWHLDHISEELRPSMVRDHMPDDFASREERKRRPGLCCHPAGKTNEPCGKAFMHDGICVPASELTEVVSA